MDKLIKNSWKLWLIGIVLMMILPITVWFGLRLMAPAVNYKKYREAYSDFFKNENKKSWQEQQNPAAKAQHEQRVKLWKETDTYKQWQKELCLSSGIKMLVYFALALVVLLIAGYSATTIPVIAAFLLLNSLIFYLSMIWSAHYSCSMVLGFDIQLCRLLGSSMLLLLLLWFAYRNSKQI